MKLSKIILVILSAFLLVFPFVSCKKYLDQKPNQSTTIPTHLSDLQAVMDSWQAFNIQYGDLLEGVADDYYWTYNAWLIRKPEERNMYVWDPNEDIASYTSWLFPYQAVLNSNQVLGQLPLMQDTANQEVFNDIKGQALFNRSFAFHHLAQLFCRPYSPTASTDLGIPLRLTDDVNVPSVRSTVAQTYNQIIGDLMEAANLLPETVVAPSRPNKAAAYGLLARVHLSMRDYTNAGMYAGLSLARNSNLLDFNSLDTNSTKPIPQFHAETLFWAEMAFNFMLLDRGAGLPKIDTNLYRSYNTNDLRRAVYFQKNADSSYSFKGSYGSDASEYIPFCGLATDEMYLIRAECYARANNKDSALHYLNILLAKRWKANTFSPITAATTAEALDKILIERRKELVFRGLRWSDLRRLNLEGANISLTRNLNGTVYTLPANDLRWVLLIPRQVINLSNIAQNPR